MRRMGKMGNMETWRVLRESAAEVGGTELRPVRDEIGRLFLAGFASCQH